MINVFQEQLVTGQKTARQSGGKGRGGSNSEPMVNLANVTTFEEYFYLVVVYIRCIRLTHVADRYVFTGYAASSKSTSTPRSISTSRSRSSSSPGKRQTDPQSKTKCTTERLG